jgi:hypothetical protein
MGIFSRCSDFQGQRFADNDGVRYRNVVRSGGGENIGAGSKAFGVCASGLAIAPNKVVRWTNVGAELNRAIICPGAGWLRRYAGVE